MKTIVQTMEEQKRVEVIQRVFRGEVTMAEAAMVLGVTERHSYRIKARIPRRYPRMTHLCSFKMTHPKPTVSQYCLNCPTLQRAGHVKGPQASRFERVSSLGP